jgi:hypothetical protein
VIGIFFVTGVVTGDALRLVLVGLPAVRAGMLAKCWTHRQ